MNRSPETEIAASRHDRRGLLYGLSAYGLWGVLPVYFKAVDTVPPIDIVAHRVLWSLPLLALLVAASRGWAKTLAALRSGRTLAILSGTALLIAVNWLIYVYAVTSGHIIAASFGYYLNPLANILLGYLVLKERLTRLQWAAVALAALGTLALAGGALSQLWISLALCVSFATYGLVRKMAPVDALAGTTIETALLFPLALAWLALVAASGAPAFGSTDQQTILLMLAGIVSTTPLLLFTAAARRLPYSTLGMLQFIAPTLQFLLAVAAYGERFTLAHGIAFGAIWTALALYVVAMAKEARRAAAAR